MGEGGRNWPKGRWVVKRGILRGALLRKSPHPLRWGKKKEFLQGGTVQGRENKNCGHVVGRHKQPKRGESLHKKNDQRKKEVGFQLEGKGGSSGWGRIM